MAVLWHRENQWQSFHVQATQNHRAIEGLIRDYLTQIWL